MADLENIKRGDRVWVASGMGGRNARRTIWSVERVTPKQILLSNHLYYHKEGGHSVKQGYGTLERVATPEECEQWDAQVAEKHREHELRDLERTRLDALRQELYRLFPDGLVNRLHSGENGRDVGSGVGID